MPDSPLLEDLDAGTVRRLAPAGGALAVVLIALCLAALLNAREMRKTAAEQPPGAGHDVAVALSSALAGLSSFLQLDQPRHVLQAALGRAGDDSIDTRVRFVRRAPGTGRSSPPENRIYSPARRLRLYLTGDSLITDPGKALLERIQAEPAFEAVAPVDTHPATGLARPEAFNWFEYLPEEVRRLHPGLVVISFGGNDGQALSGTGGGQQFGTPAWVREYARRVGGVMDDLAGAEVKVMWVGLPIPRDPDLARRYRLLNSVYRGEARRRSGTVYYLDLYRRFEDRSGHYADYLRDASGRLVLVRKPDGIHYDFAGAQIVADEVLRHLPELVTISNKAPRAAVSRRPGPSPQVRTRPAA